MRIFLVRHGESLGNLDERAYGQFGDHNVPLTEWGYRQLIEAGHVIAGHLEAAQTAGSTKLRVWFSPFLRTRQSKAARYRLSDLKLSPTVSACTIRPFGADRPDVIDTFQPLPTFASF
jgi:broad specificity phosphatase PhoE